MINYGSLHELWLSIMTPDERSALEYAESLKFEVAKCAVEAGRKMQAAANGDHAKQIDGALARQIEPMQKEISGIMARLPLMPMIVAPKDWTSAP